MFRISLPPPPFDEVKRQLDGKQLIHRETLDALRSDISSRLVKAGIQATVKSRVKSVDSAYNKLLRLARTRGRTGGTITMTDLLGLRIVTPFMADIREIENLLESRYTVMEKQRKGDDLGFQEFGYESLHYLISAPENIARSQVHRNDLVIEIQVRTLLQDAWAEVEHVLIYKSESSPMDEPMRRRLAAINANLSLADINFQEIRDYQRNLKEQLKQRREAFWDKVNESEGSPEVSEIPGINSTSPNLPRYTDQKLLEGLVAHNSGDLERAIALYSQIIDHEDRRDVLAIVYLHRGMAHFSQNSLELASSDFKSSVDCDPMSEKGYLYLGVVQAARGDRERARFYLQEALERNPYSMDALMERARLRFAEGDLQGCRDDCRSILSIDPGHEKAREYLNRAD